MRKQSDYLLVCKELIWRETVLLHAYLKTSLWQKFQPSFDYWNCTILSTPSFTYVTSWRYKRREALSPFCQAIVGGTDSWWPANWLISYTKKRILRRYHQVFRLLHLDQEDDFRSHNRFLEAKHNYGKQLNSGNLDLVQRIGYTLGQKNTILHFEGRSK